MISSRRVSFGQVFGIVAFVDMRAPPIDTLPFGDKLGLASARGAVGAVGAKATTCKVSRRLSGGLPCFIGTLADGNVLRGGRRMTNGTLATEKISEGAQVHVAQIRIIELSRKSALRGGLCHGKVVFTACKSVALASY